MEQNSDKTQVFPDFKNEDIVGLVKYVGTRAEFLMFAKELAAKMYGTHTSINIDPKDAGEGKEITMEKLKSCEMFVLGTVNGVIRHEIIFVKRKPEPAKETEDIKPGY